jgi:plastocyanin
MLIFVSVAGAQKQATQTVSIQDFRFSPAKITVKPGTKITWVNRGDALHTVTGDDNNFTGGNGGKGGDGGNATATGANGGNATATGANGGGGGNVTITGANGRDGGTATGANGRDGRDGRHGANDRAFDSGTLRPGERFSVTFKKPGKLTYHCEIHPKMKGSVIVKRRR